VELWVGAVNLGFLYAFMTMGVFITFRIHDFPDITVDGSCWQRLPLEVLPAA
jgi:putative ABC transport system permease protein